MFVCIHSCGGGCLMSCLHAQLWGWPPNEFAYTAAGVPDEFVCIHSCRGGCLIDLSPFVIGPFLCVVVFIVGELFLRVISFCPKDQRV